VKANQDETKPQPKWGNTS